MLAGQLPYTGFNLLPGFPRPQEASAMLSTVLRARQKQQLHFAPAGHVNTREGCWNFLFLPAFPSRPSTEMEAVASLLALSHGHSSPPGHVLEWEVGPGWSLASWIFVCAR